jgi:hypothetical protein
MSVTTTPMGVLLLLHERGLLGPAETACDFGSMEVDSRVAENNPVFEKLFRERGLEVPPSFYEAETGHMYGIAGDYWRALGWEYSSYDIDGRWGSIVCDLNLDHVPASEHEKYSLTMNGGTSEHVFNQHNFFLQFHNVTRVGGLMMHVVPFHLLQNHGLYSYSPTFFYSLAQYNGYEVLGLWQTGKPSFELYRPAHATPEGRRVVLISLMRRTRPGDFVFPLQVNEPMVLSTEAEERYGAFATQEMDTFRPTGVLPEEFYLDIPTATVHEGTLPGRAPTGPGKGAKGPKQGKVKGAVKDAPAAKEAKRSGKKGPGSTAESEQPAGKGRRFRLMRK